MDASNPLSAVQSASPNPSIAQSSSGQTGAQTSTSIQAPQMSVMMQQAVAMQQYQFQQALMVQQVVIAQQAATRAAVLKSAAEVAAARAAEISKQLKGSDADGKKPPEGSKSRSVSKSASRSPSQSKSKSKSRSGSPIRYRRGRPGSRSPIRYRRDYYAPYRARDYHGYRGHDYRSYYRGSYNDHSRFRYRRERDYYHRRRSRSRGRRRSTTKSRSPRRSRSRSRSRGRRRSRTLSPSPRRRSYTRSPRHSRKKNISPRVKREGTKSRQTPKRSVSRAAVRSPSVSSASIIISPSGKNRSRSPSKVKVGGADNISNVPTELSIELDEDRNVSNLMTEHKRFSVSSPARMRSSSSPVRSISVSLDNQSYQKATNRVDAKQSSPDEHCEQSIRPCVADEKYRNKVFLQAEEFYGEKIHYPTKSFSAEGLRVRKPTGGSNAIFDEESESDEGLDDWRDDLKTASKGKGLPAYKDREVDRNDDRGKSYVSEAQMPDLSSGMKQKCSDSVRALCKASSEQQSSSTTETGEQDAISDKGDQPLIVDVKGPLERRHASVSEDAEELMEGGTEGNEIERDCDEDAIFEGPKPANAGGEERIERVEAGGADSDSYPTDSVFVVPIADKMPPSTPDKKKTRDMRDVEDNNTGTRDVAGKLDRYEEKGRDRSRSRDGKRHEGELSKHEKRRDRHKKHKKKHKHENVDQDKVDDDGSRRQHKRKHNEGEHGHKERKKRKHKHRTKSPLVSAEDSLSVDEGEVRGSSGGKKRSSKRRKTSKRDVSESLPSSAPSMG